MPTYHEAVAVAKREILARALSEAGGNKTLAAKALKINRTYLQKLYTALLISGYRRLYPPDAEISVGQRSIAARRITLALATVDERGRRMRPWPVYPARLDVEAQREARAS